MHGLGGGKRRAQAEHRQGCRQGLPSPQPSLATVLPKGHPTLLPSPWPQDVPAVAPEGWQPWEQSSGSLSPSKCPHPLAVPGRGREHLLGGIRLGLHPRRVTCLLLTAMDPLLHTQCPHSTLQGKSQGWVTSLLHKATLLKQQGREKKNLHKTNPTGFPHSNPLPRVRYLHCFSHLLF